MPRRKYDTKQSAILDALGSVHEEHIVAKARLRAEIEAAFKDRMTDYEIKKSRLMNEALGAGVAKTDIGRRIGTSNWDTLHSLLSRTADDYAAVTAKPEWSYDGASKTLWLHFVEHEWPQTPEGITGDAEYTVSKWGGEHGAAFAGLVQLTFVKGDEIMRRMEGYRPWGFVQEMTDEQFKQNGWKA